MCKCSGCGGYGEWKAEQERITARNRLDFECWLAAGRPDVKVWESMTSDEKARAALRIADEDHDRHEAEVTAFVNRVAA